MRGENTFGCHLRAHLRKQVYILKDKALFWRFLVKFCILTPRKKKKLSEKKDVCVKGQHFPQRRHYCKRSSYSTGYQDKTGENNLTCLLSLADSC